MIRNFHLDLRFADRMLQPFSTQTSWRLRSASGACRWLDRLFVGRPASAPALVPVSCRYADPNPETSRSYEPVTHRVSTKFNRAVENRQRSSNQASCLLVLRFGDPGLHVFAAASQLSGSKWLTTVSPPGSGQTGSRNKTSYRAQDNSRAGSA